MIDGKEIFIWIVIGVVIIIILVTVGYVIVKNPGQIVASGGLDIIPVSEPPNPVGLTYACQADTDCQNGLSCDPQNYTCRMSKGSPCIRAADCMSGLICNKYCIDPNDDVDLGMSTFVDSRFVCNDKGLACDKGAVYGQTGNSEGEFCCLMCQPGDTGCTAYTTCGPPSFNDGYTLSCSNKSRNCPCQLGKSCVPAYGRTGESECRVNPGSSCVCSNDCTTRACIIYSNGDSSNYPVGICRGPAGNGQYCTVNEGCLSGNCSLYPGLNYGYCQAAGIVNGQTGAYCNVGNEPQCNPGTACADNICVAPNSFGLNNCDSTSNICGDSFFCASTSLGKGAAGSTGQFSINLCGQGDSNCLCLYGNYNPGTTDFPTNTTPDPLRIGNYISYCLNGMSAVTTPIYRYCIPSVINTPANFMNSAPCLIDANCDGGVCSSEKAIYRFLPLTSNIFPSRGIQGLNGIYYERIPLPADVSNIKKIFGVSVGWSVNNCGDEINPIENCQSFNRGDYDIIFIVTTDGRIMYKNIINGPTITVNGNFVMDGGNESNRDSSGWITLFNSTVMQDADAFWSNGRLNIYMLVNTNNTYYSIVKLNLDGTVIPFNISMPTLPTPGWTTISCSDYYVPTTSFGADNASILLSNGVNLSYCSNIGANGTWKTVSNVSGKANLGYGAYKSNEQYYGYPVYGHTVTTTGSNIYTYFIQSNIGNSTSYAFSKVRYPQNTYISNLTASSSGTYKPITPPNGSTVSDYSIVNVGMTTDDDNVIRFLHFAYIAKWGNTNDYYVYYVGTGFSMALPTYTNDANKVLVTPGNLYIYSDKGCVTNI